MSSPAAQIRYQTSLSPLLLPNLHPLLGVHHLFTAQVLLSHGQFNNQQAPEINQPEQHPGGGSLLDTIFAPTRNQPRTNMQNQKNCQNGRSWRNQRNWGSSCRNLESAESSPIGTGQTIALQNRQRAGTSVGTQNVCVGYAFLINEIFAVVGLSYTGVRWDDVGVWWGGMRRKRHQTRSKIINRLSAEH